MLTAYFDDGTFISGDADAILALWRARAAPDERGPTVEAFGRSLVVHGVRVYQAYPQKPLYQMDASDVLAYCAQIGAIRLEATSPVEDAVRAEAAVDRVIAEERL
jgi:hypothetical protein